MSEAEAIYAACLTGAAGQGMAIFVFKDGEIAVADFAALIFIGSYEAKASQLIDEVSYRMPVGSVSITGASFEQSSDSIMIPLSLPAKVDPDETYRVDTPIDPLNAKFSKNVSFGEYRAD